MRISTVSLSNEAYRVLKAQKKEGESFSDLVLRKLGRGNPAAILAHLKEKGPNLELAQATEQAQRRAAKEAKAAKDRAVEFGLRRYELCHRT
jgi:predicted CopG family antitoxin